MRQLIYDFRTWRSLEATGRSGSDDGFDARAFETILETQDELNQDDDETIEAVKSEDRVWLVQCKREKSINPKKLLSYLTNIPGAREITL